MYNRNVNDLWLIQKAGNVCIISTFVQTTVAVYAGGYDQTLHNSLIVFVKSWGSPQLHAHLTPIHLCECNLAFLYIILNAIGLSLSVSTKKPRHSCIVGRKRKWMRWDWRLLLLLLYFNELLRETIKGTLTGLLFVLVWFQNQQWNVNRIHHIEASISNDTCYLK